MLGNETKESLRKIVGYTIVCVLLTSSLVINVITFMTIKKNELRIIENKESIMKLLMAEKK